MNHITNQSGEKIEAVGSPNSYIRMRTQYDISFRRCLNLLCDYKGTYTELVEICEDTNVLKEDIIDLIASVYYYLKTEFQPDKNNYPF